MPNGGRGNRGRQWCGRPERRGRRRRTHPRGQSMRAGHRQRGLARDQRRQRQRHRRRVAKIAKGHTARRGPKRATHAGHGVHPRGGRRGNGRRCGRRRRREGGKRQGRRVHGQHQGGGGEEGRGGRTSRRYGVGGWGRERPSRQNPGGRGRAGQRARRRRRLHDRRTRARRGESGVGMRGGRVAAAQKKKGAGKDAPAAHPAGPMPPTTAFRSCGGAAGACLGIGGHSHHQTGTVAGRRWSPRCPHGPAA